MFIIFTDSLTCQENATGSESNERVMRVRKNIPKKIIEKTGEISKEFEK